MQKAVPGESRDGLKQTVAFRGICLLATSLQDFESGIQGESVEKKRKFILSMETFGGILYYDILCTEGVSYDKN